MSRAHPSESVFRVARMTVPLESKEEYLQGLLQTHAFISTLPGLRSQLLLQSEETDGVAKMLTIAEWQDDASLRGALEAVRRRHVELHYDIDARLRRLGVTIELMNYREIRP